MYQEDALRAERIALGGQQVATQREFAGGGDQCRTSPPNLRMTGIDRPLGGESALTGGPRFAAGHYARLYVEQFSRDGDQRPPYNHRRPDVPL
jgi:hypothetical protein